MQNFSFLNLRVVTGLSIVGLLILGGIFLLQRGALKKSSQTENTVSKSQIPNPLKPNPTEVFDSQTATVNGKITDSNGVKVTVENKKGKSASFPLSTPLYIHKMDPNTKKPTASTDPNDIELNQAALIILQLKDGVYKVISISYLNSSQSQQ